MDDALNVWRFGNVEIDEARQTISVGGLLSPLKKKPFEVLLILLSNAPEIVTQDEIAEGVWPGRFLTDAVISNTIGRVRKALGDDNHQIIETRSKVGWRIVPPVTRIKGLRLKPRILSLTAGKELPNRPGWFLVSLLGRGGTGEVWISENAASLERRVVKFCLEPDRFGSLKREVTLYRLITSQIGDDAAVARLIGWQFDTEPYFIESAYQGPDLKTWMEEQGGIAAVPLTLRIELAAQAAAALSAAHSVGVLHKDVKPSNVLVTEEHSGVVVRLCDFGAGVLSEWSKLDALGITRLGFTATDKRPEGDTGTAIYMAPELFAGSSPSVQTDVFALGVLLYQLVVGHWRPIATGWQAEIEDDLLRCDIEDATSGDASKRLPSAQLLVDRLRSLEQRRSEFLLQREREILASDARRRLERTRTRRPWLIASFAILVMALTMASGLLIRERHAAKAAVAAVQEAEKQRSVSAELNQLLTEVIASANPDAGGRYNIEVTDALKDLVPRIEEHLDATPELRGPVEEYLAESMAALSKARLASDLAERATATYQLLYGASDRRTLAASLKGIGYRLPFSEATALLPAFKDLSRRLNENLQAGDPILTEAQLVKAQLSYRSGDAKSADEIVEAMLAQGRPRSDSEWRDLDQGRIVDLKIHVVLSDCAGIRKRTADWLPHFQEKYGPKGNLTLQLRTAHAQGVDRCRDNASFTDPRTDDAVVELQDANAGFVDLFGPNSEQALASAQTLAAVEIDESRYTESLTTLKSVRNTAIALYGAGSVAVMASDVQTLIALIESNRDAEASAFAIALESTARTTLNSGDYLLREITMLGSIALLRNHQTKAGLRMASVFENDLNSATGAAPSDVATLPYIRGLAAENQGNWKRAAIEYDDAVSKLVDTQGTEDPVVQDAKLRRDRARQHAKA